MRPMDCIWMNIDIDESVTGVDGARGPQGRWRQGAEHTVGYHLQEDVRPQPALGECRLPSRSFCFSTWLLRCSEHVCFATGVRTTG